VYSTNFIDSTVPTSFSIIIQLQKKTRDKRPRIFARELQRDKKPYSVRQRNRQIPDSNSHALTKAGGVFGDGLLTLTRVGAFDIRKACTVSDIYVEFRLVAKEVDLGGSIVVVVVDWKEWARSECAFTLGINRDLVHVSCAETSLPVQEENLQTRTSYPLLDCVLIELHKCEIVVIEKLMRHCGRRYLASGQRVWKVRRYSSVILRTTEGCDRCARCGVAYCTR
jgi:hypothetical protein